MKFQRRFFNLAKWMLACNLAAMGGKPYGRHVPTGRLEFHLNGLHDFSVSLWILDGCNYTAAAAREAQMPSLFDLEDSEADEAAEIERLAGTVNSGSPDSQTRTRGAE